MAAEWRSGECRRRPVATPASQRTLCPRPSPAASQVDAIALSAGTGGTIAGLSQSLRQLNPQLRVYIIDPPSSSLAAYVRTGHLAPSPGATITEGIGIGRLTANMALARVDAAFDGVDQEAVDMAYHLLHHEGLFVGPSAALNVTAAVKAARQLGPGHVVVTVLCDGGDRYRSKLYNAEWLASKGLRLPVPAREPQPWHELSFVS